MTLTHIDAQNLPEPVRLGTQPTIASTARIRDSSFGRYTQVGEHCLVQHTVLDDYSYMGPQCDLIYTDVGKFSNIAAMVRVNPGFHPTEWPTQHHFMYRRSMYFPEHSDDAEFFDWRARQRVHIGHDTWIGHGVVIMPGVHIGNGAVVGSLSVVTRDVAPYTVVAGVPARPLRPRFSPAIARAVEATQWWNWDHDVLLQRMPEFRDLRSFLARYAPATG